MPRLRRHRASPGRQLVRRFFETGRVIARRAAWLLVWFAFGAYAAVAAFCVWALAAM